MDITRLHSELAKLRSPADAAGILRQFVADFGATSAIFTTYIIGDPTFDSFRYILAADAALCETYQKRFWFLNDPCIIYSNSNTEPIRVNLLPVSTAAQREILDEAANYGFASGVVIPVHGSPSSSRSGVLFIGSSDPRKFSAAGSFDAHRATARLLALELYDFILATVRREILDSADITRDDLIMLRMQRDGFQSKHIAKALSTTPAAVDTRFTRLNRRLGVVNRKQAVELVAQYGILN